MTYKYEFLIGSSFNFIITKKFFFYRTPRMNRIDENKTRSRVNYIQTLPRMNRINKIKQDRKQRQKE